MNMKHTHPTNQRSTDKHFIINAFGNIAASSRAPTMATETNSIVVPIINKKLPKTMEEFCLQCKQIYSIGSSTLLPQTEIMQKKITNGKYSISILLLALLSLVTVIDISSSFPLRLFSSSSSR